MTEDELATLVQRIAELERRVQALEGRDRRQRFTLSELVAQMDETRKHPETDWGPPVGDEAW